MGVSKTQFQQIHCSSELIRKAIQETAIPMQSKLKTPRAHNRELDQSVYDWFCKMRNPHNRCKPLPVSIAAIQVRAKREAQLRGISNFKASDGWLARWRWRYGVGKSVHLHGEAADVDLEAAKRRCSHYGISLWREDMPQITSSTWMRLGSSIVVCLGAATCLMVVIKAGRERHEKLEGKGQSNTGVVLKRHWFLQNTTFNERNC